MCAIQIKTFICASILTTYLQASANHMAEEMVDGQLNGQLKEWTSLSMPELLTWPPVEKNGRGSLLNHPSCSPTLDAPTGQRTELN